MFLQGPMEMFIKTKIVRYVPFIILLSILKSSVDMKENRLEKTKMWVLLFVFWLRTWKKYTADLILLTKFKKIIGMKEKHAQNMEVPVSLMEILLQTQGPFGVYFLFGILYFMTAFRVKGLLKPFRLVFSW